MSRKNRKKKQALQPLAEKVVPRRSIPLPLNIYTDIIDAFATLPDHDSMRKRYDLRNISLSCQLLRPLAQRHLYDTVSIQIGFKTSKRFQDFVNRTESSRIRLAKYIRNLHLAFNLSPKPLDDPTAELASQFLSKLHHVQALFLRSPYPAPSVNWLALQPALAAALVAIMQSSVLQTINLNGYSNFPCHALKNSSFLSNLSIRHTTGAEASRPQTTLQDERLSLPRILHCTLGPQCDTVTAALFGGAIEDKSVLDFSYLKYLSVDWEREVDVERTKALMQSACRVETLKVIAGQMNAPSFTGLAEMILQGSFRTLRNLEVFHNLDVDSDEDTADPFGNMVEELQQLSMQSNCLESVILHLKVDRNWEETCSISDGCKKLDKIFDSRIAFPHLRTLSILALFRYTPVMIDDSDEELEDDGRDDDYDHAFYNCIHRLRANGFPNISSISTLKFTFDVNHEWNI